MKDWEWELIRKAIWVTLSSMDKTFPLEGQGSLPKDIDGLSIYINGLSFEADLSKTLEITDDTFKKVAAQMAEIHQLASIITVEKPTDEQVSQLREDLKKISEDLKNDQHFKAGIAFAGALAGIVKQINA